MKQVKTWQEIQQQFVKRYPGNNIIDPRNKTAIETYNAIEGDAGLNRKYHELKELYVMDRGERL